MDARPETLSGGEQQRVAVCRALANNPEILLADEPTGNLDLERAREIMALLHEANTKGTTVVIATHDLAMVKEFGKRVIRLEAGKIDIDDEAPRDEHEAQVPDASTSRILEQRDGESLS